MKLSLQFKFWNILPRLNSISYCLFIFHLISFFSFFISFLWSTLACRLLLVTLVFCIFRIVRNTTCNGVFSFVQTSEFKICSICYLKYWQTYSSSLHSVPKLPFQVHKKRCQRSTRPLSWPKGTPRPTRRGGERKRGGAAIYRSAPGDRQARYATECAFNKDFELN